MLILAPTLTSSGVSQYEIVNYLRDGSSIPASGHVLIAQGINKKTQLSLSLSLCATFLPPANVGGEVTLCVGPRQPSSPCARQVMSWCWRSLKIYPLREDGGAMAWLRFLVL